MKTVRWAQAALLAVALPACAHTSSTSNDQARASAERTREPYDQEQAHFDQTAGGGSYYAEAAAPAGTTSRRVYLASDNTYVVYEQKPTVTVDAKNCDPWSDDKRQQCDLSQLVENSIR